MSSLDVLAAFIFDSSHRATLAEIAKLPQGTYHAEIGSDGYDEPLVLRAAMTVRDEAIEVDYAGTSGLASRGINVPPAYTPGVFLLRHQGRGCARGAEQLGEPGTVPHENTRGVHPQRAATVSGVGAPCDRPSAAPT